MRRLSQKILGFVLATTIVVHPAFAEDMSQLDAMVQTLQQGLASQGVSLDNPAMPALPTVTQAQPAPQPEERSNKNGAAKALAMAGAAMALVSCMKLMNDAKKEPDPTTKAMLQNMAMQQCSQAMKDMADAMKNDDNKKQLKASDTPKMAQLTANPMPQSKAPSEKPLTVPTAPSTPDSTPTPWEMPEAEASPTPPPQETAEAPQKPEIPITSLDPIENAGLTFNENAKHGETPAGANSLITSRASAPTNEDLKKAAEKSAEAEHAKRTGKGEGEAGGTDSDGSGGSGSKSGEGSGGDDPFAAMMSQLFGAPGDGAMPTFGGGAADIGGMAAAKSAGKASLANIFQLASYRYRVATYTDGRVKSRTGAQIKKAAKRDLTALNP